jgi:hypothetical protein
VNRGDQSEHKDDEREFQHVRHTFGMTVLLKMFASLRYKVRCHNKN